jgi:acyl dehydratase
MELDPALVGAPIAAITREVSARQIMNFAAAVSDMNPRYFDDTRSGGIQAPPLFAVAVTWPLIEKAKEIVPPEVVATMVHAGEHLIFHRPIRPDMRLRVQGEVAAVRPTSAGVLMTMKLEARDRKGQPVFTEYTGALFRGVACPDRGQGTGQVPDITEFSGSAEPIWEEEIPVERRAPYLYDGCTDIVFPIHTSKAFARFVGLEDILLQGTAALATAAREIVNREAGSDPDRLKEIACRFRSTIIPGTSIRVQLIGRQEEVYGFLLLNAEKKAALTGSARVTCNRR